MTLPTAPADLRLQLADHLRNTGAIKSDCWHEAFAAVPREAFVLAFAVGTPHGPVHLTPDDPRWLSTVYSDDSLLTQFDTAGVPTSSSTLPTLMALMLEALDVADGDKVLEVATGTGYNAALLSHRVGDGNVTTVEVDPDLARDAEQRLGRAGYRPTVLAGDGRIGHPDGGPYDRLIATCGFSSVPPIWLTQLRPGGVIVCPVGGGIVRLVVRGNGTATGAFLPDAAFFMPVRGIGCTGTTPVPPPLPNSCSSRPCSVKPADLLDDGIHFLLTLAVPRAMHRYTCDDAGEITAVHIWQPDGAWAELRGGIARQSGPRRILDTVESAITAHQAAGRPARDRYRLTVHAERQWASVADTEGPRWELG
ncbi:methyltransferase domain-containing protein [Kitasatospora sp. NPDC059673]|uniref:methyltransferase domain-containing protein n=1 Tax=Kitasatospora sp. NPDC059673 TaxID=3346901 RepID=UPI0036B3C04E